MSSWSFTAQFSLIGIPFALGGAQTAMIDRPNKSGQYETHLGKADECFCRRAMIGGFAGARAFGVLSTVDRAKRLFRTH
jgi:hypothetical protein